MNPYKVLHNLVSEFITLIPIFLGKYIHTKRLEYLVGTYMRYIGSILCDTLVKMYCVETFVALCTTISLFEIWTL